MKHTLSILFATFSAACLMAQGGIPAPAKAAFAAQFPNITEVKWEKEHGHFEAEYKINGADNSMVYDTAGTLIESEVQIKFSSMPQAAHEYIDKHHAGDRISKTMKITSGAGIVTYEAEIGNRELFFNEQGQLLPTPEKDDDEGDDDDDK